MKIYIFTVTYNSESAYVTKKFDSYKEALKGLNEFLEAKVETIKRECEYEPSVLEWEEDDITLVYGAGYTVENLTKDYALEDCAYYRIFEVEI